MPHDYERDVVVNFLRADMRHQVGDDAADDVVRLAGTVGDGAGAEAVEAEELAARAFGLGNAIGMQDDDVAAVEGKLSGGDEGGNIAFQADREAEVAGVDPLHVAVAADDEDILVLAGQRDVLVVVVEEGERQMLVGVRALDILEDGAVQDFEEQLRIVAVLCLAAISTADYCWSLPHCW